MLNEIARMRPAVPISWDSPVADSQANEFVERAIQSVEMVLRTHLLALEDKVKKKVSVLHPIFSWLVEYSVDVHHRYQLGKDGKTALQR